MSLLLYGAYGYTGRLVTERAAVRGLSPLLGGRRAEPLNALGSKYGLETRDFGLSTDPEAHLSGVTTVLNLAGPFSKTALPLARACLAQGINYLDITGEISVFESLFGLDGEAKTRGVVLLPGAGFDVVPSDCLAAHVHRRLPHARQLTLVIGGLEEVSRGTARTALEGIARGTAVRRAGQIEYLEEPPRSSADLGNGVVPTMAVSWGDVATAYHSTGIPDIEVHFVLNDQLKRAASLPGPARWFMGTRLGQWLGHRAIDRMPAGPSEEVRNRARAVLVAEAEAADGTRAVAELETPEAYRLTAHTALDAALRVDRGDAAPGTHTPSTAFGPDFVMGFPGVVRRDL
ncbi:saccharopine dehydrogenase [Pacificimonas flava]|uniref:Saccharopine dehydrogenase n=2 Tax=Pacificimonas TaxID=1960290 RepID=A0A219B322_9SPHN|nr:MULTISPECIES: saccharopine dehydrogenase NADP-binding domain-containing protein [Pacificimonas]MBZ6377568.1 saccharopine dehydrogenase NADP-binding domain-containing protein [Pacificimonas aurantium]OWV32740.1 saccharopine dehydrogenase [Pacificimonas flava]